MHEYLKQHGAACSIGFSPFLTTYMYSVPGVSIIETCSNELTCCIMYIQYCTVYYSIFIQHFMSSKYLVVYKVLKARISQNAERK